MRIARGLVAAVFLAFLMQFAVRPAAGQNYILAPGDQSRFPGDPRLLDPQRFTNPILFDIDFDPTAGFGPLPREAKDILISHRIAQQQVELAILFLEANRDAILEGKEPNFLQVFGPIGRARPAAMLQSSLTPYGNSQISGGLGSVSGAASATGQTGFQLQAQGQGMVYWANQLRPGDWIAIDPSGAGPQFQGDAIVRRVERVELGTNGQATIYLDRRGAPIPSVSNAAISKVLVDRNGNPRFTTRNQSEVLQQVIDTYRAIENALAGLDPANPDPALRREIIYRKRFTRFTDVWGRDVGTFTQSPITLDQTPSDMPAWYRPNDPAYSGNNLPAFIPDRRLRQAGFSTSTSRDHLHALEADRFGIPTRFDAQTDRPLSNRGLAQRRDQTANRPGVIDALPILWTEDNDDPSRTFFENRQLLFTPPNLASTTNGPYEVFTGPRFYSGTGFEDGGDGVPRVRFAWDGFFDWRTVAADGVGRESMLITDPFGTNRMSDALTTDPPSYSLVLSPDSGTPFERPVALRQWQLIIRTFAEWTTDFSSRSINNVPNVAVIGLIDMLTGRQHIFSGRMAPIPGLDLSLQAMDAGKYARFAGLIVAGGGGGVASRPMEPIGKRASAGFYPVVFRQ
ncbi:MAG: hypothetical protein GXP27_13885 [Planctomycetes bacterium]|nr:hypothetical protein [Planctomycetota bacterium]